MDLHTINDKLTSAKCPEDVFGGPEDGSAVPSVYRQLMAIVHPDKFVNQAEYDLATATFTALTSLKGAAERKVSAGIYGDRDKEAPPEKDPFTPYAVSAGGKKFILTDLIAEGDVCNVYACTAIIKGREFEYVFKIVHDGRDNDLLINEAKVLKKIYSGNLKFKADAADRFRLFLPEVLDSFVVREPGSQRKVSILPRFHEHRTLEEILRVFPDGIDYRDMVWMFKRIMHGLGFPHQHNVVHGGIVPSHVMIHPVNHGAKILDWSYAVDLDAGTTKPKKARNYFDLLDDDFLDHPHIKGINGRYRDYYPPEVFEKETPTTATDVYMAAKCAIALVGGDVKTGKAPNLPDTLQRFFLKCTEKKPSNRPQDVWDIHEEFDKLLKHAVGKRKYRPFPMPASK